MPIGTVKNFFGDKGYGFITPGEGGAGVFVQCRDLERSGLSPHLEQGDRVEFDIASDRRTQRPLATNLTIL